MAKQAPSHAPTEVTGHLKGITFPATRDDLVEQARENGAEGEILAAVEGLPEGEYGSIAEVMKGFGKEIAEE